MKHILFAWLLLLGNTLVFAQKESAAEKEIVGKFEMFYNQEQYENVFALFSEHMKQAVPLEKTKNFLSGVRSQSGKMNSLEFERSASKYSVYKAVCENDNFTLNIALDSNSMISGLSIAPYVNIPPGLPVIERNTTKLDLPFYGKWTVTWGGDTREQNYHIESVAQKNAFDIVITDAKGNSYKTDGKKNEDYYAFGQPIIAPCDAEVVLVVDGVKENVPGTLNPIFVPGNNVILKTKNKEYLFFAHFKQHSMKVKEGEKVKKGQLLGLCGNTGNSSEPHLHFHIQNVEDMNIATGVKCYFDNIAVNGKTKRDYSPVKGDIISKRSIKKGAK